MITEGKWEIHESNSHPHFSIRVGDYMNNTHICSMSNEHSQETDDNACLIAAAPETKQQRDDLLATITNALASLAVMDMPRLDNKVATNDEILKIMADSFQEAIAKTEKQ